MKNKNVIAESSLDDLIKDVNSAWDLAMKKLKKNDDKDDDDSDAPAAPAADQGQAPAADQGQAPAADQGQAGAEGQAPAAPAADQGQAPAADQGQAPAADQGQADQGQAGAEGQNPDQQLEQEGQQGQDGEISDEELQQIYGSMDPQELERHYMILRGILRDQYQKAEGVEAPKEMDKCGEMTISKSEKMVLDENAALKAKVQELEKSTDGLLKAVKILSQPTRKAATMAAQVLHKSEDGLMISDDNTAPLSKAEIKDKLTELCKTNMTLTKSERDLANGYFINGSNELAVLKLIGAKS